MSSQIYGSSSNDGLLKTSGPFKQISTSKMTPMVIQSETINNAYIYSKTSYQIIDTNKKGNDPVKQTKEKSTKK